VLVGKTFRARSRFCDKVMFRGSFYGYEDGFGSSGASADKSCPALLYVQKEGRPGVKPLPNQGLRSVYSYIHLGGTERGLSILCDAARHRVLPVDAPDQVGTFKAAEALDSICSELPFGRDACRILLDAEYARRRCTKEVGLSDLTASLKGAEPRTAGKYHSHLRRLSEKPRRGVPVLIPAQLALLLVVCTYFAVAKSCGELARTIFNGHILKMASHVPPPVNLLDIVLLYQMVGAMRRPHIYIADIRGWFHVLKINAFLQLLFGIICGCCNEVWMWQVLPMGWSWSPYIAQCIGWSLILHTLPCDVYVFESASQESPPQYRWLCRRMPDGSTGSRVGFVTLLYDNIGMFCSDQVVAQAFKRRVEATMAEFDVPLKYSDLFISGPRSCMRILPISAVDQKRRRGEIEEPRFPIYRGIQIGLATRDHVPNFRLDPTRVEKYRSWARPVEGLTVSLRTLARYPGVILWRGSMLFAAFRDCMSKYSEVINVSRKLSLLSGGCRGAWRSRHITLEKSDADALGGYWESVLSNDWISPRTPCQDTAPFVVATDAYKDPTGSGWGVCYLNDQVEEKDLSSPNLTYGGVFTGGMKEASIFLLELAIAYWTILRLVREGKKHIVIVIDNTGAAAVLRRMYSHNRIANEWMKRLGPTLQENNVFLRVISVRSADNASDAASRGRLLTMAEYLRCRSVVHAELEGWRRHTPVCWADRSEYRDYDPEDACGGADFYDELQEFGVVPGELDGSSDLELVTMNLHFAEENLLPQ